MTDGLCADGVNKTGESEKLVNLGRKFLWRQRMAGVLCVRGERSREGLISGAEPGNKSLQK